MYGDILVSDITTLVSQGCIAMETEPFINAKSYAAIEKILPFLQYHTPSHRIGLELGLAARTVKNIVAFIESIALKVPKMLRA